MTTMPWQAIPYCGEPPVPEDLLAAWNLDPWILAAFSAGALWIAVPRIGGIAARGAGDATRTRRCAMAWAVLFLAFVSPLCALSSALFSARVAHHLLLISLAAPLLALAFPAKGPASGQRLAALVLIHVGAVWFWHAPAPYAAALSSDAVYWGMEATLLGTAFFVWRDLLAVRTPPLQAGLAHLAIIALMGLLGALITFAPVPLYAPHVPTTQAFGLTALEDQQLAGLLMWVPAILPNLIAALVRLRQLVEAGHPTAMGRP